MHNSVALCLLTGVVYAWQPAPHRSTEEMQVKTLKVNDVELAYVEDGKGDTVVFVHGALGDWRYWESLRPLIAAKYHYVSLSRRYHYPNPWPDDGRNDSMGQHVEDVAAFIRALKVGKVHLVGNSGGGVVAAHVALKYPDLLRSVVLGEPALVPPVSAEGRAALEADQKNREEIQPAIQAAMKAGDLRQATMLMYDLIVIGKQGAFEQLPPEQQQRRLDNAKTLGMRARAGPLPVTCDQLGGLSVPALVVRGENTRAIRRYFNDALLSCLPSTMTSAVIPGGHHSWHQANPEASAKAILAFISAH
jgi:pimeloyl-ACP methyl ester carboxylesterase